MSPPPSPTTRNYSHLPIYTQTPITLITFVIPIDWKQVQNIVWNCLSWIEKKLHDPPPFFPSLEGKKYVASSPAKVTWLGCHVNNDHSLTSGCQHAILSRGRWTFYSVKDEKHKGLLKPDGFVKMWGIFPGAALHVLQQDVKQNVNLDRPPVHGKIKSGIKWEGKQGSRKPGYGR